MLAQAYKTGEQAELPGMLQQAAVELISSQAFPESIGLPEGILAM